jgi:recombination protein RecT
MPRPTQLLHPPRPPATPRPAATVLLLRDTPDGLEVLMTRRSPNASFLPGAYVFPGGGIDAADAQVHAAAQRRATQSDLHLTQAIAAIRESFEELGVLLAQHADGTPATQHDIDRLDRSAPFAAQCTSLGLTLAAHQVFVLAHWVGDRDLARRFDVPFLVARMPLGQIPVADETEQFEPVWVRPADALARHKAGSFFIIYPTIRTLERMAAYPDVNAVLHACAVTEEPLWHCCPRTGLLGGREARYMEHEAPFGELALVCPDGQIVHPLDWQSERAVPLLKNVQRLTAPNPGAMTGPGTNSYLVGDPATGYIAIDPGPADPEHLDKLWRAAGGDIRMIVCTHSHPDHSPGARGLQVLCQASPHPSYVQPENVGPLASAALPGSAPYPPILGLPSAATARASSTFTPDRTLQHNELLALTSKGLEADFAYKSGHTLQVLLTPGHAANHLCLMLLQDGLLFSGDHVLNGSTTVIDPPDGDMNDYLNSLDLLSQACTTHQLQYILPAHGYVIGGAGDEATQAIARLKQHRLQREAKVMRAMQAQPNGSLDDWLAVVYDDVPERMWPVAKRSLLAHLTRIESMMPGNT